MAFLVCLSNLLIWGSSGSCVAVSRSSSTYLSSFVCDFIIEGK